MLQSGERSSAVRDSAGVCSRRSGERPTRCTDQRPAAAASFGRMAWSCSPPPNLPLAPLARRSVQAAQRPFTNLSRRPHGAPACRRQLATAAAAAWSAARGTAAAHTLLGRTAAAADALNSRLPAVLLGVAAWAWVQPHVFLGFHPATWQGGGLEWEVVAVLCGFCLSVPSVSCMHSVHVPPTPSLATQLLPSCLQARARLLPPCWLWGWPPRCRSFAACCAPPAELSTAGQRSCLPCHSWRWRCAMPWGCRCPMPSGGQRGAARMQRRLLRASAYRWRHAQPVFCAWAQLLGSLNCLLRPALFERPLCSSLLLHTRLCRLCLVACCPGGSAAGVVGHLAGADVPLSVLLATGAAAIHHTASAER